jgi:N6-adenosine-specific RNA methylase IME4/ribosomal protein S14
MKSPTLKTKTMRIADIKVGKRHRKDHGDLESLANSISHFGLLHPVVVGSDGKLIAGERRLHAVKLLGWTDIPVNVVDLDAVVRGEFAENTDRKDFTLSEAVAIKRTLEPLEKAAAKKRQATSGGKGRIASGKLPTAIKGRAADKVAKRTGKARRTLDKAEAVVAAAEANPKKFGKLKDDMDRTGRINGVYRRLKIAKQAERIRAEPPSLPGKGPYRVMVVDLPWPYEKRNKDPSHRGALPYPTQSIEFFQDMKIAEIAHDDCILWLWVTNAHLREAFTLLDVWGFEQKTMLTWAKDKMGCGDWLRGQTEHCLMAVRGKPIVHLTKQTTLLHAPVRGHSEKPVEFYDLVETLCPAPRYADLFSRYRHNKKWDCHGDEEILPLGQWGD